jgi:HKD family nuclease
VISKKLFDDLKLHLKEAKEVWIAVALMKDSALNKLLEAIPKNAIQHYIVGIDLPTSPNVFQEFKDKTEDNFEAFVYKNQINFHPKVYLIKKESSYVAIVGSANATEGGFSNNIELSIEINEQNICEDILKWFNSIKGESKEITQEFIDKYRSSYLKNLTLRSTQKSNIDSVIQEQKQVSNSLVIAGQFFTQSDFDAFGPNHHTNFSAASINLRSKVRDRLLTLNNKIFKHFKEFGISDLHLPNRLNNYTSQHFHSRGSRAPKDAIWLNYGKSASQLSLSNDKSFTDNCRMQIIIANRIDAFCIGIWLFIGKENRSIFDRNRLKTKIKDPIYLSLFYKFLIDLGGEYWIDINHSRVYTSDIVDERELYNIMIKDDFKKSYFIGKDFNPNHNSLSTEKIEETVLTEFSKLYRLYNLIR